MTQRIFHPIHVRLRSLLAAGYVLFIVYASLSPFIGWQQQGVSFISVLAEPFRSTYTTFDAVVNLLSYIPLGLLVGLALRASFSVWLSLLVTLLLCLSLSVSMEFLQMYLPDRVSSNTDMLSNTLGGVFGGVLAVSITSWPWFFGSLVSWRSSLFNQDRGMDMGLALLVLWVFGQLNPSLLILGNVFISEMAQSSLQSLPAIF
jgi:VanZ family protein